MFRIGLSAAAGFFMSGCFASDNLLEIHSAPAGAFVLIDGYGTCETPCTVKLDEPRTARISRTGFVTQEVALEPGEDKVDITLELAAASEDVDAIALPDLE